MSAADIANEWRATSVDRECKTYSSLAICADEDIGLNETKNACNGGEDVGRAADHSDSDESDISVGGCPSLTPTRAPDRSSTPPSPSVAQRQPRTPPSPHCDEEYFKPLKKLRMVQLQKQSDQSNSTNETNKSTPEEGIVHQKQPQQQQSQSQPSSQQPPIQQQPGGLKSFSINDILSHERPVPQRQDEQPQSIHIALATRRIIRPWDNDNDEDEDDADDSMSVCSSSESSSVVGSPRPASEGSATAATGARGKDGNPLDALFQMTSKTFTALKNGTGQGQ